MRPIRHLQQRVIAGLYDRVMRRYERFQRETRSSLLAPVHGKVLEIGPGTGINFEFFGEIDSWIGVEPNPYLKRRSQERQARMSTECQWISGRADSLPIDDASVDSVVSTLVLCSVDSQSRMIDEIYRVLKPGGRLFFMEHVVADEGTTLRRYQRIVRPVWKQLADGCRTDRDTLSELQAAPFRDLDVVTKRVPFPHMPRFLSPHIIGVATK